MPILIWQAVLVTFLYFLAFFVLGQILKNNSIVDIGWGMGFVLLAGYSLVRAGLFDARAILVTGLIFAWGLRLFLHILRRNLGKGEDFRYAKWRQEWGKWVVVRAFFQVYMLQGAVMLLVALPILLINSFPREGLGPWDYLGLVVWLVGYFFEVVGDRQLAAFKSKPENRGKILSTGLWRYSRHPNYFGEAALWWGIALLALSVPHGYYGLISPVLITYLLRYVSGVPLLEQKMADNPQFREYAEVTSVFVPWFPKNLA